MQKDAIDVSRTGNDEESGPTSEVNVGKLLVGCVNRGVEDNVRSINRMEEPLGSVSNGDRLMHNIVRRIGPVNREYGLVVHSA